MDPEITAKLARARYRICEVGVGADSHNGKEGIAMRWLDAVRAFYAVLKYNFFARGPSPFPVN